MRWWKELLESLTRYGMGKLHDVLLLCASPCSLLPHQVLLVHQGHVLACLPGGQVGGEVYNIMHVILSL